MISVLPRVWAANCAAVGFRPSSSSSSRSRVRCFATAAAAAPGTGASTLYEELGVRAGATAREIKAAYRRLARERHPDVAGGVADDFVRLHRAYATLSDPDSRSSYDRGGGARRRPRRRTWETDQCW